MSEKIQNNLFPEKNQEEKWQKYAKTTRIIALFALVLSILSYFCFFGVLCQNTLAPSPKKLYSYAVLSDIHMRSNDGNLTDGIVSDTEKGFNDSIADFNRAIERMNDLDVKFSFITGDVGYDSELDELVLYKNALQNSTINYYPVRGNHDTKFADDTWALYTGVEENFEIVKGNDVFLGMSMYESGSASSSADTPFDENATWLLNKLDEHKGKRISVFMHLPFPGYAGLRDGEHYGFSASSAEDDALLNKMNEVGNVTCYSGHTHFEFGSESTYPNMNVYPTSNNVNLVHVPSCAYPRNALKQEVQSKSQCYIVDVYENKTVLRAFDLVTGKYMKNYVYTIENNV